ncbi:MAG: GNAT family N-acetyltransferase [Bryobacterales bacterium]|nr:GNAT family N-acetyltransferase [Bryobacterales bacterium]
MSSPGGPAPLLAYRWVRDRATFPFRFLKRIRTNSTKDEWVLSSVRNSSPESAQADTPWAKQSSNGRHRFSSDHGGMDFLRYTTEHATGCLAIFDAHSPDAFHPSERPVFEGFLAAPHHPYWVMLHEGAIVGCGGFLREEGSPRARLHWGMVHRDFQRQGLGRFLMLFRLREIGKLPDVEWVELGTTPLAAPFFEKQGFRPSSFAKDGWGPGMDRVEMAKKLSVCA